MKNSSQDFKIKKEFIDLQLEIRKFIEEANRFTLRNLLKDPLIVYPMDDYLKAYREDIYLKKVVRTLKKLQNLRKKNINISEILEKLQPLEKDEEPIREGPSEIKSAFKLKSVKNKPAATNERMIQIFKSHMKRVATLKKYKIHKPTISRNFSVSSSHSHLMKKYEKVNDLMSNQSPKQVNEITSNITFRNGVLKPSTMEKPLNRTPSPMAPRMNSPQPASNIIKANRSPRLPSDITPNPDLESKCSPSLEDKDEEKKVE